MKYYLAKLNILQEEIEEDDGDSIEKVLWHQPKGMAAEAQRHNRSTEPILMSHLFDSVPDWDDMEFLIKWKSQSHLHCQWKSFVELQNVCFLFVLFICNSNSCAVVSCLYFSLLLIILFFIILVDLGPVCLRLN